MLDERGTLFLFATPATGAAFVAFTWVFAAALCALAAAMTVTTKSRPVAPTPSVADH
jgi:hypothetical protein